MRAVYILYNDDNNQPYVRRVFVNDEQLDGLNRIIDKIELESNG